MSGTGFAPAGAGRPRLARVLTSTWPRLAALVLLLAGATALLLVGGPAGGPELLRDRVAAVGPWGPVLFALGYALGTVLMVPNTLLTLAAGALFGPGVGSLVALAGATTGAAAAFQLGRALGRPAVNRLAGGRLRGLDAFLARRGLLTVAGLRLLPVAPFTVLNFAFGTTAMRLRDYAIGSAFGMAPGVVAYTTAGGSLTEPTSPPFLAAVAGVAALTLGGAVAARRLRPRRVGADRPGYYQGGKDLDVPEEAMMQPFSPWAWRYPAVLISGDDPAGDTQDETSVQADERAARDLSGYDVEALDGGIGSIDEANHEVGNAYLVVDTGPWIFGRKVLLPAGTVDRVDHDTRTVYVDRTKDQIKSSPEYDKQTFATPDYRDRVGTYYTDSYRDAPTH